MATKNSCRETIKVLLKFWILWVLGFLSWTLTINGNVSDMGLEIKNLLKSLNKPYVKSIKSPYGYVIDCVPINLQPAFDNPLLKNHTIQMKPSYYPKELFKKISLNEKTLTQPLHTKGRCPKGTVPIIRTTMEDILKAKSIQSFGKKPYKTFLNPNSPPTNQTNVVSHEYACRIIRHGEFYGGKANIGLWTPRVENLNEFSLAQIWLVAGTTKVDLNTIEVGWQVYPSLYNDTETHLFGYWTRDSYKNTGCYNVRCAGFVQTNNGLTLGDVFSATSKYQGIQIETLIFIFKDRDSGNWWLKVGESTIGYWPASIFTKMRDSATIVQWGGEVVNQVVHSRHTMTEMESGAFSIQGYKKAATFVNLQIVDRSNASIIPNGLENLVTHPRCYDLVARRDEHQGEFFYYGGPGRNSRCL